MDAFAFRSNFVEEMVERKGGSDPATFIADHFDNSQRGEQREPMTAPDTLSSVIVIFT